MAQITFEQIQNQVRNAIQNAGNEDVIDVSQIEQAPEPDQFNLPDEPSSDAQAFSSDIIANAFQPQIQELEGDVNQAEQTQQGLMSRLMSTFQAQADLPGQQIDLEEEAGIPELQTQLTDITNKINQKELTFRRERERIQTMAGLTAAQKNARLADVSRKQTSELADLAVIQQAKSNNLENAQSIIDRKVSLMTEQLRIEKDINQFFFENNKDILDTKEQRLFETKLKQQETQLNQETQRIQQLENEKLDLVRNANINGAGNNVLESIMSAQSIEDAYKAAGRYGLSLDDQISRAQLNATLSEQTKSGLGEQGVQQANDILNIIDKLSNSDAKRILGDPRRFTTGAFGLFASEGVDFKNDLERLKNLLTVDNLDLMSGVLSETDIKILSSAATNLKLGMSEEAFNEELSRISNKVKGDLGITSGVGGKGYTVTENGDIVIDQEISDEQAFNQIQI